MPTELIETTTETTVSILDAALVKDLGTSTNVDKKLITSAKRVLLHNIEFVPSSKPHGMETMTVKSKYILTNSVNRTEQTTDKSLTSPTKLHDSLPSPKHVIYPESQIHLEWAKPRGIGCGLVNLGNTCFLNSTLQCLTYTPPLANYCLTDDHHNKCNRGGFCMMCELQRHMKRCLNPGHPIRPESIINKLHLISRSFQRGRQEDAHEFLRYVVDHLQKASVPSGVKLDRRSKATTVVDQIFGGYLRSQVTCSVCKASFNTYDPFMDIGLDIRNCPSIERSLQKFVRAEMLAGDNAYMCPNCKKKVTASKRFHIHKAPCILTLQLKRFDHTKMFNKIVGHIPFTDTIDLREYMSSKKAEPVRYHLYAVLVHSGNSVHMGHYYCYVRAPNSSWYLMNDSSVQQVPSGRVHNAEAYLLFYVRKGQPTSTFTTITPNPPKTPQTTVTNGPKLVNGMVASNDLGVLVQRHGFDSNKIVKQNISLSTTPSKPNSSQEHKISFGVRPRVNGTQHSTVKYKDSVISDMGKLAVSGPKPVTSSNSKLVPYSNESDGENSELKNTVKNTQNRKTNHVNHENSTNGKTSVVQSGAGDRVVMDEKGDGQHKAGGAEKGGKSSDSNSNSFSKSKGLTSSEKEKLLGIKRLSERPIAKHTASDNHTTGTLKDTQVKSLRNPSSPVKQRLYDNDISDSGTACGTKNGMGHTVMLDPQLNTTTSVPGKSNLLPRIIAIDKLNKKPGIVENKKELLNKMKVNGDNTKTGVMEKPSLEKKINEVDRKFVADKKSLPGLVCNTSPQKHNTSTHWVVQNQDNIQSPSMSSNCSNTSVNSTTEWHITELDSCRKYDAHKRMSNKKRVKQTVLSDVNEATNEVKASDVSIKKEIDSVNCDGDVKRVCDSTLTDTDLQSDSFSSTKALITDNHKSKSDKKLERLIATVNHKHRNDRNELEKTVKTDAHKLKYKKLVNEESDGCYEKLKSKKHKHKRKNESLKDSKHKRKHRNSDADKLMHTDEKTERKKRRDVLHKRKRKHTDSESSGEYQWVERTDFSSSCDDSQPLTTQHGHIFRTHGVPVNQKNGRTSESRRKVATEVASPAKVRKLDHEKSNGYSSSHKVPVHKWDVHVSRNHPPQQHDEVFASPAPSDRLHNSTSLHGFGKAVESWEGGVSNVDMSHDHTTQPDWLDQLDAELDVGRTKKIKKPKSQDNGSENKFQQLYEKRREPCTNNPSTKTQRFAEKRSSQEHNKIPS